MTSSPVDTLFSADALNFRPNAIRAFAHLMNDPRVISLAGGAPSPLTFPAHRLAEIAAAVVRDNAAIALQYGATPGLPRLRATIASIAAERKIECAPENVIITTGSQQALNLLATALLDPGDVVLVELPSYVGALATFYGRRATLAGVRQDEEGMIPEDLAAVIARVRAGGGRIKFLYTIPNFQNPSGRLLAASRRGTILEIARREGILVIEDDPYGELVFDAEADTTPIASAPGALDDVVYLGSFSKVLAPGLRCGFVIANPAVLQKVQLAKEAADLCSGMLDQSIVDAFCAAGELPAQVARVRDFYRARSRVLLGALEENLDRRARWTQARGGLFTFLTVAEGIDARALVPAAIDAGVAYVPGAPFFVDGSGANTMRLTFAKEPDDRMRDGVRRLASVIP
jgi:DNA-binding transcriptional MocR family regulator